MGQGNTSSYQAEKSFMRCIWKNIKCQMYNWTKSVFFSDVNTFNTS